MATESLAVALEREHREIDEGIAEFTAALAAGVVEADPLLRASQALRRHIYLEERFLLPPLREAGFAAPVFVMLREHGQIWRTLDTLDSQVASGADPATLHQTCRELEVQLQHHNLKEERILYPQSDHVLTETAQSELRDFLEKGHLPDGWVCERASS
ncbi:MAG TPA: hemerythrin domain-containing protein [Micromonosporaceae bacterium]|nr:hemerythrin domain-containing protein [Micromonosporaceae bacterium]